MTFKEVAYNLVPWFIFGTVLLCLLGFLMWFFFTRKSGGIISGFMGTQIELQTEENSI